MVVSETALKSYDFGEYFIPLKPLGMYCKQVEQKGISIISKFP